MRTRKVLEYMYSELGLELTFHLTVTEECATDATVRFITGESTGLQGILPYTHVKIH